MSKNKQRSRRVTLRIATYICIEIYLGWFDNLNILLINCTKLRYYNNDKKRKRNPVLHVVRDGSLCAFLSRKLVTL